MTHPGGSDTPLRDAGGRALKALGLPGRRLHFTEAAEIFGVSIDEVEGMIAAVSRDVDDGDDDLERTVGHCLLLGIAIGRELR
jgi:hypothetical protein